MSPTCTNSHYDNHATFVPSINHNKDVALLSYVELYVICSRYNIHVKQFCMMISTNKYVRAKYLDCI